MTDAAPRLVVVAGPTASGKSSLALWVAQQLRAHILVVDSRQVYRGMDVGTAKATAAERALVVHHGLDLVNPGEQFDAAMFVEHARGVITRAQQDGVALVVEGGTGLYLRALVRGLMAAPSRDEALRERLRAQAAHEGWPVLHARLREVDPVYAARVEKTDPVRITRGLEVFELTGKPFSALEAEHAFAQRPYQVLGFVLATEKDAHAHAVAARVTNMWNGGLLPETRQLLTQLPPDHPLMDTINYAQARDHLVAGMPATAAMAQMRLRTTQFAKRQRTWFRKETWLTTVTPGQRQEILAQARVFLGQT